ncbi:phosphoglycerate mutase [Cenarchaeum symbiosum A]|uniref:Phosphoglycerate mutase n=1 Tax=Cenarchaeum symbiosum (strain A) TaxID=414004 RepID=A0RUP9_CENSY|nr:phosphoglycerate mutase [Cenarchaeum symbiosum A]
MTEARMVYVLLDGVGDLPHPDLGGKTPLEAASTPNMDRLAVRGAMGEVISVGEGIAPESDIAVFNMLGYRFGDEYPGRGVIEAIGTGADFKDGDLALRGNFATLGGSGEITDRRAGRNVGRPDAEAVSRELEEGVRFSKSGASVSVIPSVGHRVTVRIRSEGGLSGSITNTDPAYERLRGMGVAKDASGPMRIDRCRALDDDPRAQTAAELVNEFSEQAVKILGDSGTNERRAAAGAKKISCILLRDAGSRRPVVEPIEKKYSLGFSCIADMPVELGISEVLGMEVLEAGGTCDYEQKAAAAAGADGSVYVHLKGPDEFGHDGDAAGKTSSIEDIDGRFFGPLLGAISRDETAVVISADHSTPCISKGHSDDPVPLLVSGALAPPDGTVRFTEAQARSGMMGRLAGADVLDAALNRIRS